MPALSVPGFFSLRMAQRFSKNVKHLNIETVTKMEISLRWLLFFGCLELSM
jgi:hypothetical protein